METLATTWVLYELTGSAVLTGLNGLFRAAPFLLLTPFAGALADRIDQRRLLLVTQSWGMLNSLALGLLVLSPNPPIGLVIARSFSVLRRVEGTTSSS